MELITVGGQVGAGGSEIGLRVAHATDAPYVHHLALRMIARRLSATAHAVAQKELNFGNRWARFASQLEMAFERMAWHAGSPGSFPVHIWEHEFSRLKSVAAEIADSEYLAAVRTAAEDLARRGKLVLVMRAGCLTLRHLPQAVHVGLFAPRPHRVARIASHYGTGLVEAEDMVEALEHSRRAWFKKLGGPEPEDLKNYDVVLNTDLDSTVEQSASRLLQAISET